MKKKKPRRKLLRIVPAVKNPSKKPGGIFATENIIATIIAGAKLNLAKNPPKMSQRKPKDLD